MSSDATSPIAATVAANIKHARSAAGLTQHQLAVALDVHGAMAVSRWERGEHRPSDEAFLRLAEVLGRPVGWFYTDHAKEAV